MMWKKLCITLCVVCFAAFAVVPCAFADDAPVDSSASSSDTSDDSSDSSFLGDAGALHDSVSGNFSDGVDSVADSLKNSPGEIQYMTKDDFPKFIKEAISFIPLSFWWAFQFAIILGFVNALYRRMS